MIDDTVSCFMCREIKLTFNLINGTTSIHIRPLSTAFILLFTACLTIQQRDRTVTETQQRLNSVTYIIML